MSENETTLDDLKTEYRSTFPEKKQQLEDLLNKLLGDNGYTPQLYQQIHQAAHRLFGSAPLYGFDKIAASARHLKDVEENNVDKLRAALEAVIEAVGSG